jgi:hypothetical protein
MTILHARRGRARTLPRARRYTYHPARAPAFSRNVRFVRGDLRIMAPLAGCMLHFSVAVTEVVVRSRQLSPVLRQPGPVGQCSDRLCISATRLGSGSWPAAPQLLDEQAV